MSTRIIALCNNVVISGVMLARGWTMPALVVAAFTLMLAIYGAAYLSRPKGDV